MVLSIRTYSKSGVSARVWKSLSQTPECDQRRKRAWTAVHLPNTSGRSRQRAALPAIHKMASTNSRLSPPLRPGVPIRFHCSSVSVRLLKACSPSTALNQNFTSKGIHECRQRLKQVDDLLGFSRRFAACFRDERHPGFIEYQVEYLVRQRIMGLALGYEDLNDHDALRLAVCREAGRTVPHWPTNQP